MCVCIWKIGSLLTENCIHQQIINHQANTLILPFLFCLERFNQREKQGCGKSKERKLTQTKEEEHDDEDEGVQGGKEK